ncbi:helix-turn-helix transcriptional regulator [Microvirga rosea]|uniref:helix-turn-helix transcriptional regulator n=1 Tax=Microvirga rosea TaxID=2715425 RepID=UPI001D0A526F|nr:LuxR family transcriptional regulator [Microvirga rosea]MCB8821128.1 LuxR family transcriptional regulator [Microvirga rosea]
MNESSPRKALTQTIGFIQQLERARSPTEVCGMLLPILSRFGAEHILAGLIPRPDSNRQQQISHIILDHWPADWSRRYFTHGYIARDPAIKSVSLGASPFLWSDLRPLYRDSPAAWRVMEEASDFRLKSGFTIPLATLEGDVAGFSIAGERLEIPPEERGMLTLLATYALGRALLLREADLKTIAKLSPREREALQWAAEGKSEWEIGEIMGISEHGVDKHMRAARMKLGTTSRTHAVAEAIRMGLIN